MAQLNITLDQDEILRLLADNSGDAFKILLQEALNSVLRAESAEQLAHWLERRIRFLNDYWHR